MKNLLALAIIVLGFTATSFAQVTATASTTATIITPIAIEKDVDMNFGNIAVSPTLGGTVVLPTSGARTKTGGVTLPVVTGTVSAASFTVTGEGNSTYSITLPSSAITLTSPSGTMTVENFVSTPSNTGALNNGSQEVKVGATLNVGAAQAAGTYTNESSLFVTVNYN
ncbi:MAG: DUF4402 domain-containing protein [Bacteroidales bacterium]|jgi:hypothetical protein|nr:DUF4402 domain-containing protein [Bacteroidales bacterium]MBK7173158.1 DUF4402 domain-containing protein [Bacteroidales bacterium]MBK7173160.1 DUF4402 domain-containing protein [Bacteroidales bacterium]MBK7174796.1 DUF4402 domain-containing protein [Bacteroidales bacterium]MBK7174799.1 DUF4402 domain-containing protein [Bacteroidales bacterium]